MHINQITYTLQVQFRSQCWSPILDSKLFFPNGKRLPLFVTSSVTLMIFKIHLQYFAIVSQELTDEWTSRKPSKCLPLCAKIKCTMSFKIQFIFLKVYFKLEEILVSVHSWKIMGLGPSSPLFFRNGQILGLSPVHSHRNSVTIYR